MMSNRQYKRLICGFAIVLLIVLAVPTVQLFMDKKLDLSAVMSSKSKDSDFEKDVCSLANLDIENFQSECDGSVVGFTVKNPDTNQVGASINSELETNGWRKVASSNPNYVTYVAENRRYSWLFLALTKNTDSTTVVMTLQ